MDKNFNLQLPNLAENLVQYPTRKCASYSTLYHGLFHKMGAHFCAGYCTIKGPRKVQL